MIQYWLECADREEQLRAEWALREARIGFYDPCVATSETFEELEQRLGTPEKLLAQKGIVKNERTRLPPQS